MSRLRRVRRWCFAVAVLGVACLIARAALPWLVARVVRGELAARGFPDARFEVASVGIDHLRLTGVWLEDGLALGEVELDAGPALLWRAPEHATVRHARIAPRARPAGTSVAPPPSDLPVGQLRLEDAMLQLGDLSVDVGGTIARTASGSLDVDLDAALDRWELGSVVARAIRIHASGISARDAVAVSWAARGDEGAGWTAHGRGRVEWRSGRLELADGHTEIDLQPWRDGRLATSAVHVVVSVTGDLAAPILDVVGVARASEVEVARGTDRVRARYVQVPLRLGLTRAGTGVTLAARAPIEAAAPEAEVAIEGVVARVVAPVVVLRDPGVIPGIALGTSGALRWRAAEARLDGARFGGPSGTLDLVHEGGVQRVAWRAASGPSRVELGEGTLDVRLEPGGFRIAGGRVRALGGELSIAPGRARTGRPLDLAIAARGLSVGRVLAALDHAGTGTGALDADLGIRITPGRAACDVTARIRAASAAITVGGIAIVAGGAHATLAGHATSSRLAIDAPITVTAVTATVGHGDHALVLAGAELTAPPVVGSGAWPRALRWRATGGRVGDVQLVAPAGTVALERGGEQTIAWRGVTGPWSVRADDGELGLRVDGKALEVVRGHLHALGGELEVEPTAGGDLRLHVRGLALDRALDAVSDRRVAGTGLVDGELVLAQGGGSAILKSGILRARGGGVLRVTDAAWRARVAAPLASFALQQRLADALADLAYSRLTATISPLGANPELRLSLRGQGERAPHQAIDVDLHLNGMRAAVSRFTFHNARDARQELP